MCGVCLVYECNVLALRICRHTYHILHWCVLGDIELCCIETGVHIIIIICFTVCISSAYTIMHNMFLDFLYTYSQDNREAIL